MFKFKFLFMRALVFQPILLTIRLFLLKRTFKIVVKNALIGCFILIYLFKSIYIYIYGKKNNEVINFLLKM